MSVLPMLRRACAAAILLAPLPAAIAAGGPFNLISDLPSGQPVGTTITWTIAGNTVIHDFRLDVGRLTEPLRHVYAPTARRQFQWTPIEDGIYRVTGTIRDLVSGEETAITRVFAIRPAAREVPVVNPTRNPLVALYSAPPCATGQSMEVSFAPQSGSYAFTTSPKVCDGQHSMNFYLAGMRPETT